MARMSRKGWEGCPCPRPGSLNEEAAERGGMEGGSLTTQGSSAVPGSSCAPLVQAEEREAREGKKRVKQEPSRWEGYKVLTL